MQVAKVTRIPDMGSNRECFSLLQVYKTNIPINTNVAIILNGRNQVIPYSIKTEDGVKNTNSNPIAAVLEYNEAHILKKRVGKRIKK